MTTKKKVWIDLDNTPHVPFFRPIIRELESRGEHVLVTARDAFQVCDLADTLGVNYTKIGRHYGKNPARKILGLIWRSLQLVPLVIRERPEIAVSHGSRAQILLCNILRIPTVLIIDYEHVRMPMALRPRWEIVPEAIRLESLHCNNADRILAYPGIKEDVYVVDFRPSESLEGIHGYDPTLITVTCRPPANEAHYHASESDDLFESFMNMACSNKRVQVILLPRNKSQERQYRDLWPQWFEDKSIVVPDKAMDGLNLLWHSDLVVSGGGTMNREAAALGIPVYSLFKGPTGSVDRELERQGRLVMIGGVDDIATKISIEPRQQEKFDQHKVANLTLVSIIRHLDMIRERESGIEHHSISHEVP